ncbi:MAG: glutamate--tRNA ligase [Rickettsiales bacterium]|nr:glutamate--tRNA ligase [Rickettsiales bacterium]
MTVITRFAPSPTGFLHIGGARTALFNWLFARHHDGKFLLRIEDTDKARSTTEAIAAIHEGLTWLGLDADDTIIYQSKNVTRHTEVAEAMLANGKAYKCFTRPEELAELREAAQAKRNVFRFQSPWRDTPTSDHPTDTPYVIRLKAPNEGVIIIKDEVQGDVNIGAGEVEDVILLRSDGTPTYMLAVVTDDHDMAVTHIIRGDDHLTNSAKQQLIYEAMGWDAPVFAHIPLIHGPDGAKLSKRHGALGVDAYRDMGYLPEAMRNYLLRLGWAFGDEEIFTRAEMIEKFSLKGVGKSPSRFDFAKLENLNGMYIRQAENDRLIELIIPFINKSLNIEVNASQKETLNNGITGLKERAKTLQELADSTLFYLRHCAPQDEKAQNQLDEGKTLLAAFIPELEKQTEWDHATLFPFAKEFAEQHDTKVGKLMAPIRVAITGSTASPSMFEVMEIIGKEESLKRLRNASEGLVSAA